METSDMKDSWGKHTNTHKHTQFHVLHIETAVNDKVSIVLYCITLPRTPFTGVSSIWMKLFTGLSSVWMKLFTQL